MYACQCNKCLTDYTMMKVISSVNKHMLVKVVFLRD